MIVLCVRWYLRYCLTLRDLEELMMERGLSVDHSSIARWVLPLCSGTAQASSPGDAAA
jgi:transposase-like protein